MSEFQKRVNAELAHIKLCEDDAEVIYRIAQEVRLDIPKNVYKLPNGWYDI